MNEKEAMDHLTKQSAKAWTPEQDASDDRLYYVQAAFQGCAPTMRGIFSAASDVDEEIRSLRSCTTIDPESVRVELLTIFEIVERMVDQRLGKLAHILRLYEERYDNGRNSGLIAKVEKTCSGKCGDCKCG